MRLTAFIATILLCLTAGMSLGNAAAEMSAQQLLAAEKAGVLVLDVRSDHEYDRGHLNGALHIPHRQLQKRLAELAGWQQKPIVVYCESGYRANLAASILEQEGFDQVFLLNGHMRDWRNNGRELAF